MTTTTAQTTTDSRALNLMRIIVAYLGFIAIGLNAGLLGLAWTPMRAEFNQPIEALGLLLLASTAGYLTTSFLAGSVTGRIGIGATIIVGGVLLTAGLALTGLLSIWLLMIPVYIVAGLGSGLIDAGLNAYVAEHNSKRALNWLHACFGVGTTAAPLLVMASAGMADTLLKTAQQSQGEAKEPQWVSQAVEGAMNALRPEFASLATATTQLQTQHEDMAGWVESVESRLVAQLEAATKAQPAQLPQPRATAQPAKIDKTKLVAKLEQGMSATDLAQLFGVSESAIRKTPEWKARGVR